MTNVLQPRTLTEITVFCAEAIEMTGSAITLSTADNASGDIAGSNAVCLGLQHEQSLLGEGPANDARSLNGAIAVSNFAGTCDAWPVFSPIATRAGMKSALALPLTAGVVRLGALVFYNAAVTTYSQKLVGRAKAIAVEATNFILEIFNDSATSDVMDGAGVNGAGVAGVGVESFFASVVHQATGMIAAQRNCDIDEAIIRMRAHAFSTGQSLYDVSRSVVQRELRFD